MGKESERTNVYLVVSNPKEMTQEVMKTSQKFIGAILCLVTLFLFSALAQEPATATAPDDPSKRSALDPEPSEQLAEQTARSEKDQDQPPKMRITNDDKTNFDSEKNTVRYTGNVVVNHPAFVMTCDQLEVFMSEESNEVDRAVATGYVTIRKANASEKDGGYYVGKSRRAIYRGADETVTLTDWPQIQKDASLHIAEARSTTMTMNEAGQLETDGPVRTVTASFRDEGED